MVRFVVTALVILAGSAVHPQDIRNGIVLHRTATPSGSRPESREAAISKTLREISDGHFESNDSNLIARIKESIVAAARSVPDPAASLEAGANRAQDFVSSLTSAYTTAILRATSAPEAQRTLARFQDSVQQIVDFAKSGKFLTGLA
ncbi:uncharacterized protein LOC107269077 [Cephus cinctus]|uniref:Uncharacterized protein LOC107269077 n=1 Tax=Cephus cinctus TaxID=211228 RepID=A0AAJ7RJG1_CEPCN|nr:uncharacterized protein LOC107269077 [Cephus cinctus]XP_024942038.1 uncharacterized protein LOC107269077 [Cephus cinctus]XP_024942039.1 uncharacterized protein LOC107269077 [Cephus cinctus]